MPKRNLSIRKYRLNPTNQTNPLHQPRLPHHLQDPKRHQNHPQPYLIRTLLRRPFPHPLQTLLLQSPLLHLCLLQKRQTAQKVRHLRLRVCFLRVSPCRQILKKSLRHDPPLLRLPPTPRHPRRGPLPLPHPRIGNRVAGVEGGWGGV